MIHSANIQASAAAAVATNELVMASAAPLKQLVEGLPLVEPEVRRSAGGELQTTLMVGYAYRDVGGQRLFMRTYDGQLPGATLRAQPGDVLRIRLVNDLPEPTCVLSCV